MIKSEKGVSPYGFLKRGYSESDSLMYRVLFMTSLPLSCGTIILAGP